eukprot:7320890-Heterocapsa_arctica.AAC.1
MYDTPPCAKCLSNSGFRKNGQKPYVKEVAEYGVNYSGKEIIMLLKTMAQQRSCPDTKGKIHSGASSLHKS